MAALLMSGAAAEATPYEAQGPIAKLFSTDRSTYGPNDSVLISGFASAGTCPTNDGLIAIALRDDEGGKRQLAMLLAAKFSGVEVRVRIDDQSKNASGVCHLLVLEIP